ncbi:MAG: hypothetical protein WA148_01980 [Actinomycetota bacterium]
MIKRLIALALIFALVFPAVALAKGKPADTGKGAAVGRPDKPGKPESPGKSGENKVVKPGQEPGEGEGPDENGNVTKGKPENPGEKGRMNAINRILEKWFRMPESALKGLWNAVLNISKKIVGYVPVEPTQEQPGETQPEEPPTTEPIEQPAEQL